MRNKLIILTSSFPYGKEELFLESEIQIIAPYFKEVEIIAVSNKLFTDKRQVPQNVLFSQLNIKNNYFSKVKSFFQLASFLFWKEVRFIYGFNKPLNLIKTKTILRSCYNAKAISRHLKIKITHPERTIIYSYWSNDNALATALLKFEFKDLKVVTRAHGWDVYFEANQANYLPFRKTLLGKLDNVHTVSDAGNKYVRDRWKVDPSKVLTSRLGVCPSEKVSFSEQNTIVSCSHINSIKRLHLIVEALCQLDTPVKWVHIGAGDDFAVIKQLCEEKLTPYPHISWDLLGRIPNVEIIPIYLKVKPKLFINVSSTEGVPVSIMEAISCGLPVIATRVGGNPEIVHESNGIIIDANPEISELVESINRILTLKKEDWEMLSSQSIVIWNKSYNLEANYRSFAENLKV